MARNTKSTKSRSWSLFSKATKSRRGRKGKRLSAYVSREHDWQTDVPNLKLSRAFGFVLALHIVAVGGILGYEIFKKDRPSPRVDAVAAGADVETQGGDAAPTGGVQTYDYRVVAGDSISIIAEKAGSSVEEIRRINDIFGDQLDEGLILQVPVREEGEASVSRPGRPQSLDEARQAGSRESTVSEAPSKSRRARVTVAEIASSSQASSETSVLRAIPYRGGDKKAASLSSQRPPPQHPAAAPTGSVSFVEYTVQQGDTLYSLGRRHGVTPGGHSLYQWHA